LIEYISEAELRGAVEKTFLPSRNISKIMVRDVNHYIFPSEVYLKRRHKNKWKAFRQRVKKKKQSQLQNQSAGAILQVGKPAIFTPSDLRNEFKLFGRIKSIYIFRNGSAYIRFKTANEAATAYNGLLVNNMGYQSFSILTEEEEEEYWNNYFKSKDKKQPTSPRGTAPGALQQPGYMMMPPVAPSLVPPMMSHSMPSLTKPPSMGIPGGLPGQGVPISPQRYSYPGDTKRPQWGYNPAENAPPVAAPPAWVHTSPRVPPPAMNGGGFTVGRMNSNPLGPLQSNGRLSSGNSAPSGALTIRSDKETATGPAVCPKEPEGLHLKKEAEARRWGKENGGNLLSPTSGSP
jgi:hypothetical protein